MFSGTQKSFFATRKNVHKLCFFVTGTKGESDCAKMSGNRATETKNNSRKIGKIKPNSRQFGGTR